jgi:hypothetical protein
MASGVCIPQDLYSQRALPESLPQVNVAWADHEIWEMMWTLS